MNKQRPAGVGRSANVESHAPGRLSADNSAQVEGRRRAFCRWISTWQTCGVTASTPQRDVIGYVATRVIDLEGDYLRIAVDGVDGSGKTAFAERIAAAIRVLGRPVVRISLDDFHNVRSIRYRQGRDSPDGFWQDSYNYARFHHDVLDPFSPGGSRRYRPAAHDVETDAVLHVEPRVAEPGAILVVDGLFLHRKELVAQWDLSVFLDVPFEVTAKRMAVRDGTSPDPNHPSMHRYVEGQRIYFRTCSPHQRASIVIDNQDFDAPRILRGMTH
ncbi:uridine kinase [Actinoplanes sp. NPDC049316]|uniref:uridine kinase n=1 Tax=Actinoplanes sp. NPDC049316 TaxID=3154727 RepID=UPI003438C42D